MAQLTINEVARQIATDEMGNYWQNNYLAAMEMGNWLLSQIEDCIDNHRFAIKENGQISIVIREQDIFKLINHLNEQL